MDLMIVSGKAEDVNVICLYSQVFYSLIFGLVRFLISLLCLCVFLVLLLSMDYIFTTNGKKYGKSNFVLT